MRTTLLTVVFCLFLSVQPLAAQPPIPKPGPEHALLKKLEGDWDATVSFMGGESKATASNRIGFGGFWLTEHFQGEFAGMKFEGRATMGYDPIKKKYVATWIDSMSASFMLMEGSFSKDGKTFTEFGEGPNMEGKMEKMKNVYQFKDKDTFTMTMYKIDSGKDEETMKINYKRKK